MFGKCFLQATKPRDFYQPYMEELNALDGQDGWFTQHYAVEQGEITKAPFQRKNLRKLDAIRQRIEEYHLDDIDKAVLLTSLMFALDKVDSTLGHYVSYLADWSPRSYDDMRLEVPNYQIYDKRHTVLKGDVFEIIKGRKFDLAYFDPPYGLIMKKCRRAEFAIRRIIIFGRPSFCMINPSCLGKSTVGKTHGIRLRALFLKNSRRTTMAST